MRCEAGAQEDAGHRFKLNHAPAGRSTRVYRTWLASIEATHAANSASACTPGVWGSQRCAAALNTRQTG
jgi:hypothetical protein